MRLKFLFYIRLKVKKFGSLLKFYVKNGAFAEILLEAALGGKF